MVHLLGNKDSKQPGLQEIMQATAIGMQDLDRRCTQQAMQIEMLTDLVNGLLVLGLGTADNILLEGAPLNMSRTDAGVVVTKMTSEEIEALNQRTS